ncbi:MAG: WD40 repeat domain-containing protein, partial [Chromatiales bacterium]
MTNGPDPSNPFPGLRHFTAADSALFFGRDQQIGEVLRRLRRHRFLAVIGASGSGKSSLIRAGVIPSLIQRQHSHAEAPDWRLAIMTPGNAPIANLARALAEPDALGRSDLDPALRRSMLEATLRRGTLGLLQAVQQARMAGSFLLLVDQFEELFRIHPQADEPEDQAAAFVRLIMEASAQREVPIYVLLTMRLDYLGDCVGIQGLTEVINRSQYLIPNLNREQRREVITGPIAQRGAEISPPLLHRLLNDVGENASQLTTLQHALMRTWDYWQAHRSGDEPLDLKHYEAIGTLQHALEQHADDAWAELADRHRQKIAEIIFKRLTEKGADRREVRHPTTLGDLCAVTEQTKDAILPILETFRRPDRCFLLPALEAPLDEQSVLDIAHESLIRVWRQLRTWADEEAESAAEYLRLVERMARYRAGQDTHLQNPALRLALDWRQRYRPNQAWANRYDRRFADAMRFLDESEAAHHKAEAEKEAVRQRELQQARALAAEQERRYQEQRRATQRLRRLALALLVVFALAVFAAIDAWRSSQRAANEANQSLARSQAMAAVNSLDLEPKRSLLLALQAASTSYQVDGQIMPVAFSTLNRAIQAVTARPVLKGHERALMGLAFTASPGVLVSVGRDDRVLFWDIVERKVRNQVQLNGAGLTAFAVSADRSRLAVAGQHGGVQLWSDPGQTRAHILPGTTGPVSALAFSPDGRILAAADLAGKILLWDSDSRLQSNLLEGHQGRVSVLSFRPDGRRLASAGWDGTVHLWDPAQGSLVKVLRGHSGQLSALSYSPDGTRLASADWEAGVRLWDGANGALVARISGHSDAVLSLAFSPNSRWLASGGRDTRVLLSKAANGQPGPTLAYHTGSITALDFDPSGFRLASAGADGQIYLWDPESGRRTGVLPGHTAWINTIAFSPDGRLLASGDDDGSIVLWRLDTSQGPHTLVGFEPWQAGFAIDPGGTRIAYLSGGEVKIID